MVWQDDRYRRDAVLALQEQAENPLASWEPSQSQGAPHCIVDFNILISSSLPVTSSWSGGGVSSQNISYVSRINITKLSEEHRGRRRSRGRRCYVAEFG
jgi:hypothetical protein